MKAHQRLEKMLQETEKRRQRRIDAFIKKRGKEMQADKHRWKYDEKN